MNEQARRALNLDDDAELWPDKTGRERLVEVIKSFKLDRAYTGEQLRQIERSVDLSDEDEVSTLTAAFAIWLTMGRTARNLDGILDVVANLRADPYWLPFDFDERKREYEQRKANVVKKREQEERLRRAAAGEDPVAAQDTLEDDPVTNELHAAAARRALDWFNEAVKTGKITPEYLKRLDVADWSKTRVAGYLYMCDFASMDPFERNLRAPRDLRNYTSNARRAHDRRRA